MMWRSGRFSEGKRRLGWWFALWLVLPGLRCAGTLEPTCGDDNVPHARNFRDGFQVVNSLLAPVSGWTNQFSA